jgi:hypothetical protein
MLQSTPGVAPMLARTLVAEVQKLWALNRQEIVALIGVAPFNRDGDACAANARSGWPGARSSGAVYEHPGGGTPRPSPQGILCAAAGGQESADRTVSESTPLSLVNRTGTHHSSAAVNPFPTRTSRTSNGIVKLTSSSTQLLCGVADSPHEHICVA